VLESTSLEDVKACFACPLSKDIYL
jgi:hypothetical protein